MPVAFLILIVLLAGWRMHLDRTPDYSPTGGAPDDIVITSDSKLRIPPMADLNSPLLNYPQPDTINLGGVKYLAKYAPDTTLSRSLLGHLKRNRPEHAVVLVCDLKTGLILAVGERSDSTVSPTPRMALTSTFPAASLSKIITALAVIEEHHEYALDGVPHVGAFHTLYRWQLLAQAKKSSRLLTLEEAFARSVNPAFGILGLAVGASQLKSAAERLGFNGKWALPILSESHYAAPDSGFGLAEHASGFTRSVTISPFHALFMARGIGDDGFMRPTRLAPSLVNLETGEEMPLDLDWKPHAEPFISSANLPRMRALMEATVSMGTARKGFHSVMRRDMLDRLDLGGKTGSLNGDSPPGRYDWYIGYAKLKNDPSQGIAICTMIIHQSYQSIRASQLSAMVIRDWAKNVRADTVVAVSDPG